MCTHFFEYIKSNKEAKVVPAHPRLQQLGILESVYICINGVYVDKRNFHDPYCDYSSKGIYENRRKLTHEAYIDNMDRKRKTAQRIKESQDSTPSLASSVPESPEETIYTQLPAKKKPTVADLMMEIEGMQLKISSLEYTLTEQSKLIERISSTQTIMENKLSNTPSSAVPVEKSIKTGTQNGQKKAEQFLEEFFDDYCAVCEDFGHQTTPECKGI
jgi:hypothetical protein